MLTIEVNGTEYINLKSVNYRSGMLDFNNECIFVIGLRYGEVSPIKVYDDIVVRMDNNIVMKGYIYKASITYGNNDHTISFYVTDYTRDFADSSIDVINDLSASLCIKHIIESVIKSLGISGVSVEEKVQDLKNFSGMIDRISPEVGENAFDYCDGLCYKRQVIMRTNSRGNIELVRNSKSEYNESLRNAFGDTSANNMITGSYDYDISQSFNRYIVKSNETTDDQTPYGLSGSSYSKKASNQVGKYVDPSVRNGRQQVVISQEASSSVDNVSQAKWLADYGRATRTRLTVNYSSHSLGGEILEANRLVRVYDDFTGIDDLMLIDSIECTTDLNGGDSAIISLIDKNSFDLSLKDPSRERIYNDEADNIGFKLQ